MISVNQSIIHTTAQIEGEFFNDDLGKYPFEEFECFAFYRSTIFGKDEFIKLAYRITADQYIQVVAHRKYFEDKYVPKNSYKSIPYPIESQYKLRPQWSFARNIYYLLYKRIRSRYMSEGIPVHLYSKYITTQLWKKITSSIVKLSSAALQKQFQHPIITTLNAYSLSPQPVNLIEGEWVANCPNNVNHKMHLNVLNNSWSCSQCSTKKQNIPFSKFAKTAHWYNRFPHWFRNFKQNAIFKSFKFKILNDRPYTLLLKEDYYSRVDIKNFVRKETQTMALFLKTITMCYPFDPELCEALEGQYVAVLIKDEFKNLELYLTVYIVQNGRLKFVENFMHYPEGSLGKRTEYYNTLPAKERLKEFINVINGTYSRHYDIITTTTYN